MKSSFLLAILFALLPLSTLSQTIPIQTFDTSGVVQTAPSTSQLTSIEGTWTYPTTLKNPISEPGTYFYTQYIGIDLLPNSCPNFIQVGTNITLDSPNPNNTSTDTQSGTGFYVWNNITNPIIDQEGQIVTFLAGDTVTATIIVDDDATDATVILDSTRSGSTLVFLSGGSLCLEHAQWAIGSAPQELMPDFDLAFFTNATARVMAANGDLTEITPVDGSLVNLVITENGTDSIQAEPEDVAGEGFTIEFQPDD